MPTNPGINLTPLQFEAEMKRWANKQMPLIGKKIHAAVTEHIYLGITMKTPVLTARARGNWVPSLGVASQLSGDFLNAGVHVTGAPNTGLEKEAARAIKHQLEALPLGRTKSYITNRLDYIELLEDGSISMKSPPNAMVQGTIINTLDGLKVDIVLKGVR